MSDIKEMEGGLINLIETTSRKEDLRGFLNVLYETDNFVLKRSYSKKGVFRGMHRQVEPYSQTKIIRVVSGSIIDFVVETSVLSNKISWKEINANTGWVLIRSDLLHGFYALEDVIFEYICDGVYREDSEENYSITDFLDKHMNIKNPILSEKDLKAERIVVEHSNV